MFRRGYDDSGMAQNFLRCDREQELLLPPSLRDWLAADHLAWFVLDVVDELDLAAFRAGYREDGCGRAAFDPAMTPQPQAQGSAPATVVGVGE